MKKSNLRNFQAYRMYQAPEGGAEKPVRTSYLKDLSEASTGRGGGGAGAHPQRHGQNVSGQYMSGLTLADERIARGVITLEGAGSCPVVNLLHSTCQQPSDSRGMTKPARKTASPLFKGLGFTVISPLDRGG